MIGMVLTTHGRLAEELVHALEHVVGSQTAIATVCVYPDDDMERRRADILESVRRVDSGGGVIVFVDMFGGTPSNLAISIMNKAKVEVIAGVNLPMLVKMVEVRGVQPFAEVVDAVHDAGHKYMNVASKLLAR